MIMKDNKNYIKVYFRLEHDYQYNNSIDCNKITLYTKEDWERDDSLQCQPFQQIEKSIYDEMFNAMPVNYNTKDFFQTSEAYDHMLVNNKFIPVYGSYATYKDKCYFLGYIPNNIKALTKAYNKLIEKIKKQYFKDLIEKIRFCCQVDDFELLEENNDTIMQFSVADSDSEYYFEEFNIEQKETEDDVLNRINLSKLERENYVISDNKGIYVYKE